MSKLDQCPTAFSTKFSFNAHLKIYERKGSEQNECLFCEKTFSYQSRLNTHLQTHTKEKCYHCKICRQEFAYMEGLVNHQKRDHGGGVKTIKCEHCDKMFFTKDSLRRHSKVHPLPKKNSTVKLKKSLKCNQCGKTFSAKSLLTMHLETHDPNRQRKFKCDYCTNAYFNNSDLQSHRRRAHFGMNRYACVFCEKSFIDGSYFNFHLQSHTKEKWIHCKLCGREYSSLQQLTNHHKTEHSSGVKTVQCNQCDKSFFTRDNLSWHHKAHHQIREKKFGCDLCPKLFLTKAGLNDHVTLSHTQEKIHQCNLCPRSFALKSILMSHLKSHTGEKPFKCNICNKSYCNNVLLKEHINLKHSAAPTLLHECKICEKRFARAWTLKEHRKIHTGEKLHPCNLCSKSFRQNGELYRHLRTHTGEKPFKCEICNKAFARKHHLSGHLNTHRGWN